MKKSVILAAFAALTSVFTLNSAFAATTTLSGAKAQAMIVAYRSMGAIGAVVKNGTENKIVYRYDVSCERQSNMALDTQDLGYAIATFSCDIGAGQVVNSKAQVLFEAAADAFGSDSGMGKTWAEAKNLECDVNLNDDNTDTRFTCTYDSGN